MADLCIHKLFLLHNRINWNVTEAGAVRTFWAQDIFHEYRHAIEHITSTADVMEIKAFLMLTFQGSDPLEAKAMIISQF